MDLKPIDFEDLGHRLEQQFEMAAGLRKHFCYNSLTVSV